MTVRLEETFIWYRPLCFNHVNAASLAQQLDLQNKGSEIYIKKGHLQPRCHQQAASPASD